MADGLLLTRRERLRRFQARFAAGAAPSLALVLLAVGLGDDAVAVAIGVLTALAAIVVGTSARTLRGAAVAGAAVAVALLALQLVLAWFVSHPVLPR